MKKIILLLACAIVLTSCSNEKEGLEMTSNKTPTSNDQIHVVSIINGKISDVNDNPRTEIRNGYKIPICSEEKAHIVKINLHRQQ